jgi:hypothetical protein
MPRNGGLVGRGRRVGGANSGRRTAPDGSPLAS